jgi:Ser/Thr protein kinase RdoA (MazF antagonist)
MKLENIISRNWEFKEVRILNSYNVSGGRLVCKVSTEGGDFIIKGIPTETKEEIVISNTKAHQYLGNTKKLAPALIYLSDGRTYLKEESYYYYIMEFIQGRQLQENEEDELFLGRAAAQLHELTDYDSYCSFNCEDNKKVFRQWFSERSFKAEYDAIIDGLPNFKESKQCFIHTDIGPHNGILTNEKKVIFVDLDDSGIGPKYIDLGWPFIMQFVDYNRETQEMQYKFDLAKAFLKGYYGGKSISKQEIDMIWNGAIYMHIAYMQCYGPDAVDSLWSILKFGIKQKEILFQQYTDSLAY